MVILLVLCGEKYLGKLMTTSSEVSNMNAVKAFYSLEDDSVEVLIYGASHGRDGVDPKELYDKYGIGAFNRGGSWQTLSTTDLMIRDTFRTQSPKVILIETYFINHLAEDIDPEADVYYTKAVEMSEDKMEYLKNCFGGRLDRYLSYYFPLFTFHENWSSIGKGNFIPNSTVEYFIKNMGYNGGSNVDTEVEIGDYSTFRNKELKERSIEILDGIVDLCKKNNTEIIFFTIPYQGEYGYIETMTEYAEENGCTYINLFDKMDEIGISVEEDFRDSAHLNDSGAMKVSDYLGKYIVDHYEVTDMRLKSGNQWEKNLSMYEEEN